MAENKKEVIRKLSEHLAPFPVFEAPKEESCLAKWQQTCVDNGLLVPETVLTHTYYKFDNLKQFRSNQCTNDWAQTRGYYYSEHWKWKLSIFADELRALCHFLPFIPEERVQEFLDQYYNLIDQDYVANQLDLNEVCDDSPHSAVKLQYDYIIVVANKCNLWWPETRSTGSGSPASPTPATLLTQKSISSTEH